MKRIYRLHNAADKLGLQISPGRTRTRRSCRWRAFKFFDKHLRGEERAIERAATKQFEPEELKVFEKLPTDQRNTTIHETFTRQFVPPAPAKTRDDLRELIRKSDLIQLYRSWPSTPPVGWAPRHTKEGKRDGLRITSFDIEVADGQSLPIYVLNTEPAHDGNPRLQLLDEEGWSELLKAIDGPIEKAFQERGDEDERSIGTA